MQLFHAFKALAPFFTLAAALALAQEQEGKSNLAKVTIAGKQIEAGTGKAGKGQRIVLELQGNVAVNVLSEQQLASIHKSMLEEHRKLTAEFEAQLRILIEAKDFKNLETIERKFKAASEELLEHIGWCAAEGVLTQDEGKLQLEGKVRVFQFKAADKGLGKGKALVEGEAVLIEAKTDKTALSPQLAIRNGDTPIFITGKAAQEYKKVKGTIRAWGLLRPGPAGIPALDAEKIEIVK